MVPPLAITQCVDLRKPATLKVTANFKRHGRNVTTFGGVLTKTQPTKSPLSSPAPAPRVSTDSGTPHEPIWHPPHPPPHLWETPHVATVLQTHRPVSSKRSFPRRATAAAERCLDTRRMCPARGIQINPLLLPLTAKKGLFLHVSRPYCLQVEVFTDSAIGL